MPEGDLRGSLMRLNSCDQFPASNGYSDCQNVTTLADQHPKARVMASWHVQTEENSEITTPSVGHPPLSLGCTLVQLLGREAGDVFTFLDTEEGRKHSGESRK